MQRRATPLILALVTVTAIVGRDAFILPLVDRIQSRDVEVAGCVRAAEGETFVSAGDEGFELYPGAYREPERASIGRNSSMYEELRKLGVSSLDIELMTRQTKKTFDWRKIRAGQTFDLYATQNGVLDSLVLYTSPQEFVRVHRSGEVFVASVEQVPFEVSYVVTHGTIRESIFSTLMAQGAETALATSLEDIFGWTIDFVSDIRQGDQFVILYERRDYETGYMAVGDVLAARVVNSGKEFNAVRFALDNGSVGYYKEDGSSLQKSLRRAPIKFSRISSNFQKRRFHPVQKVYKPHYGVDYAAPRGTHVYSTGDGLVVAAEYRSGNGNFVKVRHNKSVETYYLHLAGFAPGIRRGARVEGGQLIGFVGSTGLSTGPHLCYRMMRNGSWINPRAIDLPAKDPVTKADMARFSVARDTYMATIHAAMLDGVENKTAAVAELSLPTRQLRASVF